MTMPLLCSKAVFRNGNAGTAGTAQQWRGLACSLIKQKSGNTGTQLCLINNHPAPSCSRKKTQGTDCRPEKPVLERFYRYPTFPATPNSDVVTKGVCDFFLTPLSLLVPRTHVRVRPSNTGLELIPGLHGRITLEMEDQT